MGKYGSAVQEAEFQGAHLLGGVRVLQGEVDGVQAGLLRDAGRQLLSRGQGVEVYGPFYFPADQATLAGYRTVGEGIILRDYLEHAAVGQGEAGVPESLREGGIIRGSACGAGEAGCRGGVHGGTLRSAAEVGSARLRVYGSDRVAATGHSDVFWPDAEAGQVGRGEDAGVLAACVAAGPQVAVEGGGCGGGQAEQVRGEVGYEISAQGAKVMGQGGVQG